MAQIFDVDTVSDLYHGDGINETLRRDRHRAGFALQKCEGYS